MLLVSNRTSTPAAGLPLSSRTSTTNPCVGANPIVSVVPAPATTRRLGPFSDSVGLSPQLALAMAAVISSKRALRIQLLVIIRLVRGLRTQQREDQGF